MGWNNGKSLTNQLKHTIIIEYVIQDSVRAVIYCP